VSRQYVVVVPAYGRDYRSKKAVLADWEAGKDFVIRDYRGDMYINKADLERERREGRDLVLQVRYNRLERVMMIGE